MSRPILTALALAACASAASAAPRYTIELLADLPGGIVSSQGMSINNAGTVGGQSVAADGYYATQWAAPGRAPVSLGDLPGGYTSSLVYGINDAGTAAGTAYNSTGLRGFRKEANGVMVELKDLPGGSNASGVWAINNGNVAVGYSYSTASGSNPTAVYWGAASVTPVDLGDLPGSFRGSQAKAINDAGVITGVGQAATGKHAWSWTEQGGMVDINGSLQMSESSGINEAGWIVGYGMGAGSSYYHATAWHDGQIVDLGAGNVHSFAQDVNNRNQVVGASNNHAMLWLGAQSFDLLSLVEGMPAGVSLERAMSINDAGQITGYGSFGGNRVGFVLTEIPAVPEPATWTLMFTGLLATGALARRRRAGVATSRLVAWALAAAALGAAASGVQAAEAPSSLAALFGRVPDLPPNAEAAAAWVDKKSGRLVHAPLLALADELQAHQRVVGAIVQSRQGHQQAQTDLQVQAMSQGMADVGIEMERMQRDPAYAAEVQARMKSMTPAQMMAMSQKMAQPMNRDRRIDNEALLVSQEMPAVQAAGEAGFAYANAQVSRLQARDAIWREADEAVARINARPLKVAAPKPRMESDNIGCDKGCQAAWDAYASQMLPLMVAREDEILAVRRAALQRHRAAVAPEIQAAERHLAATRYGAAAKSQTNLMRITGYDGVAVGEVQQLLTRIEETVKRAAIVPNCGKQIVLVPGAVCQ